MKKFIPYMSCHKIYTSVEAVGLKVPIIVLIVYTIVVNMCNLGPFR